MLTPYVGAPALALVFLALLASLGSGVTRYLGRGGAHWLLLAPAIGLATGTALLTTVSALTPLAVAGPLALALASVASVTVALVLDRPRLPPLRAWLGPVLITLTALSLALAPVLLHGTYGPVNLYFMDSWFFVAADEFLANNSLNDPVRGTPAIDPTYATVENIQRYSSRLGIDVLQTSLFGLTGTNRVAGQYPAQAAYVATVGLTTYGLARTATALPRHFAIVSGILSVSVPVTVQLWVDPRPANLVAVILAPLLLYFGGRSVTTGSTRDAAISGIALAGIVVSYVEHAPTIALAGVTLATLGLAAASGSRVPYLRRIVRCAAVAVAVGVALSPPGWARAAEYARNLEAGVGGPPIAGLDSSTIGPLLAGTAHVYELARIPLTAPIRATVLFNVTAAVLTLVGYALWRSPRLRGGLLGGVYASLLLASVVLALYFRWVGNCGDYCVQKALTLTGPAVAMGVAMGFALAARWAATRAPRWQVAFVALACIYLAFVARATYGLQRGAAVVPMAVEQRDFAIPEAVADLPSDSPLLVEGAEAVGDVAVFFDIPAALELAGQPGRLLRYDTVAGGALAGGTFPGEAFVGDYEYVLTRFPGIVHGDRRPLRTFGQYGLARRQSSTDVTLVATAGTRDPKDRGANAIPWLRGPITLRAVGAERGMAIRLRFQGAAAQTTGWSVGGAGVQLTGRPGVPDVCILVGRGAPVRDITLVPEGLALPMPPREPTQAFQRAPRALGLSHIDSDVEPGANCR